MINTSGFYLLGLKRKEITLLECVVSNQALLPWEIMIDRDLGFK